MTELNRKAHLYRSMKSLILGSLLGGLALAGQPPFLYYL